MKAMLIKKFDMDFPRIVCLCGSTRFTDAYREANLRETLAGKIVLTVGCDTKSDLECLGHLTPYDFGQVKAKLDDLHKRKIDLADEIFVLNVHGYIGESTQSEIEYARKQKKVIRYLDEKAECAKGNHDFSLIYNDGQNCLNCDISLREIIQ